MRFASASTVVTGGTSGIGLAIAKALIEEGARVAVCGRDARRHDPAGMFLGAGSVVIPADVTDSDQLDAMLDEAAAKLGPLDIVVANAGGLGPALPLEDVDAAARAALERAHRDAVLAAAELALPRMREGGVFLVITAAPSDPMAEALPLFAQTKAAARAMLPEVERILAPRGVRVVELAPELVDTPASAALGEELRERLVAASALGRMQRPEELAAAALDLLEGSAREA